MANPAEMVSPVASIDEAIERMEAITASNTKQDGLACFNHLYTAVTREVARFLTLGEFADAQFLDRLDVAFANRYFEALRAWGSGQRSDAPRVWRALLERRGDGAIASIQFAAAGVNAHINLDLAIALVKTSALLGVPLGTGTQRADYEKINGIFASLYRQFRDDFVDGKFEEIDQGRVSLVLDAVSHFAVDTSRDAAWETAELIIDMNGVPFGGGLATRFTQGLDRTFGFAGRGLLVRVPKPG